MAKGPKITDEVIGQIAKVYLEHPDWRAKEIQHEAHARLRKHNPGIPAGWPGLSAVQKVLTEVRANETIRPPASKRLDGPWSIDTLAEYEIPPEALPAVLKMAIHFRQSEGRTMTIREAKWAARLSALKDLFKLRAFILAYSEAEKTAELTGIQLGSESFTDNWFYRALTHKAPEELVFDEYGKEIPGNPRGFNYNTLGSEKEQSIKLGSEKKQKGGRR